MVAELREPIAPALLLSSEKITASHRGREAYVYVRQSTPSQVVTHTESLARQYELRERAIMMGWPAHQVVVIDADLGRSGADATARLGFQELVADVGLGKVGIVLGIEVSRLARNNADWYQLLDLCALTDTLIADADGIYHPAEFNDRLVLGLKGTMSEAELHLIRSRLTAGLKHKAARGELRQGLPVGLDYDADDQVVLSPDEAVREAIATVFRRFAELGSARQVLLSLREDGVLLPRRQGGDPRIRWAGATYPAVHDLLSNPAYAGAFVFGRTRTEKRIDPATGRVSTRVRLLPREQWEVLIPDHHLGFIDWTTFEANTAKLRANWRPPRGHGGGAPREGTALLQGLLRCGRCGRIMQIGYSGPSGNTPRYLCARAQQLYTGQPGCQSIGGRRLENTVLNELFTVLEPAALITNLQHPCPVPAVAEIPFRHRPRVSRTSGDRRGTPRSWGYRDHRGLRELWGYFLTEPTGLVVVDLDVSAHREGRNTGATAVGQQCGLESHPITTVPTVIHTGDQNILAPEQERSGVVHDGIQEPHLVALEIDTGGRSFQRHQNVSAIGSFTVEIAMGSALGVPAHVPVEDRYRRRSARLGLT